MLRRLGCTTTIILGALVATFFPTATAGAALKPTVGTYEVYVSQSAPFSWVLERNHTVASAGVSDPSVSVCALTEPTICDHLILSRFVIWWMHVGDKQTHAGLTLVPQFERLAAPPSRLLVGGRGLLEGLVFAHAPRGPFDVEHDGVVHEPVEDGGRRDGVAEDLAPLGKPLVGRDERGVALS